MKSPSLHSNSDAPSSDRGRRMDTGRARSSGNVRRRLHRGGRVL
jgi:hypothetical protein